MSGAGQVLGGWEEQSRARESPPRSSTAQTTGSEGQTMPPVRRGGRAAHRSHRLRCWAQPAERRRRRCVLPWQGNAGPCTTPQVTVLKNSNGDQKMSICSDSAARYSRFKTNNKISVFSVQNLDTWNFGVSTPISPGRIISCGSGDNSPADATTS